MATAVPIHYNVDGWIEENKKYFLPPVCNKMMHNEGQMKLFFVGGPNQRKDYHIEAGEELFLQIKGDMVLKVCERGVHRDVTIKEGEIFLLPSRIPHSPQRKENTVGLVIERDRHPVTERDGLRYYVNKDDKPTLEILFEEWFYCTDLGSQLGPVIKRYFASEQHKTGKPIPGTVLEVPPLELDTGRKVEDPFSFNDWISSNREKIDSQGRLAVFDVESYQFQVFAYGKGCIEDQAPHAEAWVWQWEGESSVTVGDKEQAMKKGDSLLIPIGQKFVVKQEAGSVALVCYQDPTKAVTWYKG